MKEKCVLRKTYKVSFTTIHSGDKDVQIPVYTPIHKENPQPEP